MILYLKARANIEDILVDTSDINRPALQLAGYFEHYEETRPQIIGFVEYSYMENMPQEQKMEVYPKVLTDKTPCVIFCRDLEPDEYIKKVFNGVFENLAEIDALISENAVGWRIERISKTALSLNPVTSSVFGILIINSISSLDASSRFALCFFTL